MEQKRKYLKLASFLVLLFTALDLVNVIVQLYFLDLTEAPISAGSPENILLISKIVFMVITLILLAPQIYIGIRGLQIAKNPKPTKGHIVWAKIIFGLVILAFVNALINVIRAQDIGNSVSALLDILLEITIYFDYIQFSTNVLKELQSTSEGCCNGIDG